MVDQAKENLNSETGASGAWNNVANFEIGKSKLNQKEIDEAAKQAVELTKIEKENFETNETTQWTQWNETKKNIPQNNVWTLPLGAKTAIENSDRPDDVKKWLENSYITTQNNMNDMNQSVQNSKLPWRIKKTANRLFKK